VATSPVNRRGPEEAPTARCSVWGGRTMDQGSSRDPNHHRQRSTFWSPSRTPQPVRQPAESKKPQEFRGLGLFQLYQRIAALSYKPRSQRAVARHNSMLEPPPPGDLFRLREMCGRGRTHPRRPPPTHRSLLFRVGG